MAKLPRVYQKIFAENAVTKEIGQFGSAVAGAKKETGDIAEIQALPAWEKGWSEATVSKNRYPAMQERNGIDKVVTQQLAYMFQEGIPEWDSKTEYSSTGLVKGLDGNNIKLYRSLKDGNVGHLITETDWWGEFTFSGEWGTITGDINSQTDLKAKLDEKVNTSDMVKVPRIVNVYQNGRNGYIAYSNKLCHQWGYVSYPGGAYTQFDINLLKTLKNAYYFVGAIVTGVTGSSGDSSAFRVISQATNKFTVRYVGSGNNSKVVTGGYWQIIGYLP